MHDALVSCSVSLCVADWFLFVCEMWVHDALVSCSVSLCVADLELLPSEAFSVHSRPLVGVMWDFNQHSFV